MTKNKPSKDLERFVSIMRENCRARYKILDNRAKPLVAESKTLSANLRGKQDAYSEALLLITDILEYMAIEDYGI